MSDSGGCSVRFELLGPLRAWREDASINLGPVQQRVVLAALLLQQNRLIGRQQLVNAVWGEAEPRYAANLLHRHVSGLRRVLGLGRNSATASGLLAWIDGGYLLTVPAGSVDLEVFDKEVDRARQAQGAGDPSEAAGLLRRALALWRGPVCDGLSSPFLDAQRDRLNERRINVVEECIELDLAVGGQADLLTELRQLVADHPLREKLHGLLMLALYRSGRRADALAAFQDVRNLLRKELGVDPAAPLQRLHQQILTADPELAAPAHEDLAPGGASLTGSEPPISHRPPTPAQLPHSIPGFSNRDTEIRWLNGLLAGQDQGPDVSQTGEIVAITGTAGVGKTTLAVHWAHRVRDRFPDGQLYVNLRGFDPAGPAMEPSQAIRVLLGAFAVPPDRFPVDLDAQAALYRTMLADRHMLIVLDNARDADQVRPLLPGAPSSLVIVTSRNQLLSLIAADGARPLEPDLLSADQARRLLSGRLGPQRVAADPAAMDEIVNACAGLPLALSMVGARAAANSRLSLAELAEELRETRGKLSALGEDTRTDLRAVFSWSYQALSAAAARLFRLLGLHAGPDIGVSAAASLVGLGVPEVRALLAELTSAHLVTDRGRGRFTFHDLLRAYARELAAAHDPAEERREAIHRVLDYYLHTACRADELLRPSRVDKLLRPNRDDAIVLTPVFPLVRPDDPGDHRKALAWFATEYQALLSAVRQAASNGFDVHTWQLAWALESFFGRRGHWHDAVAAQEAALDAANRLGDPHAQARSRGCLAYAYIRLGRYGDAHAHLLRAPEFYEQLGELIGQAHAHRSLSWVLDREGSYHEALSHALQAAELFQAGGHQAGQARALNAIGWFHIQLGDPDEGFVHCRQALSLQKEIGDQFGQADTLDSIAAGYRCLGHYQEAIAYYKQALYLYCEFGDRYDEADALACVGDTHLADGAPASAEAAWSRALTILDELGHPDAAQVRKKLDRLADAANRPGVSG